MVNELDYVFVLKALKDIPFGVGKKLLVNYLQGKTGHESILKNNLNKLPSFGSLAYGEQELDRLIGNLILNNLIKQVSINGNRFWKVMELSKDGYLEIDHPKLYKKKISQKISSQIKQKVTQVTDEDRKLFSAFGGFLDKYNDEQKKAIICKNDNILCIAGAGSGKTTVLTKRIEFLINYKSVDPIKILAITFTRKAKQEMASRLENLYGVSIETFNSFCEKVLMRHNDMIYDRPVNMINYRDKIQITRNALLKLGINMNSAINQYFSTAQRRSKTPEQLSNIFMNDCFFVRDYLKSKGKTSNDFDISDRAAQLVFGVGNYIDSYMRKHGKRDFADQLMDTIKLFESHNELIPQYDYILIDEYQDINFSQIKLIELLNSNSLFCVGDPRQSIFGWRGSNINYILDFEEKYKDSEIITLTKNYRSNKHLVDLINKSILEMGLLDLESTFEAKKNINLVSFNSELNEFAFVIQEILSSKLPREEIFILARTNRQLIEFSNQLKIKSIPHVIKSDEINRGTSIKKGSITLATIHAIKGLEAEMVFVLGCTILNFPCRGSEHPVIDMVKMEEYDKEEEEKRLFYVAMSRAKNHLYLTYSGKKHTYFITDEMLNLIEPDSSSLTASSKSKFKSPSFNVKKSVKGKLNSRGKLGSDLNGRLRSWRTGLSVELGIPAFMIMHDKTLIEIIQMMPKTKFELGKISGIGPTKVMKYGDELLDIINSI